MSQDKLPKLISEQTAKELQIFLDELALERELETWKSPLEEVQEDVINHLTEIRDLLNTKIQLMQMRNKNIY